MSTTSTGSTTPPGGAGDPDQAAYRPGLAVVVTLFAFSATLFEGYDIIVYGGVLPTLLREPGWNLTPSGAGLIGGATFLGMAIGAVLAGWLGDRFGRRRVFIGLLTWFSLWMLAVTLAPGPVELGVFRFVAGIGFGGIPPLAVALMLEFAPPRRRLFFGSLGLIGFIVGAIAAGALTAALLDDLGFRGLFAVGVLPLVTIVPLAFFFLPESPAYQRLRASVPAEEGARVEATSSLRRLFAGRTGVATALFAVATFCGFLLVFGLNTWLPELMRGAGYALGGQFLVALNGGALVGSLLGTVLADRWRPRPVAFVMFLLAALFLLLLSVPLSLPLTYAVVFGAGFAAVGQQAVMFGYVGVHYAAANRAGALGVTNGFGRLGALAGPVIGGFLVSAGLGLTGNVTVFAAFAAVGAVAALLVPVLLSAHAPSAVDQGVVVPGVPEAAVPEALSER